MIRTGLVCAVLLLLGGMASAGPARPAAAPAPAATTTGRDAPPVAAPAPDGPGTRNQMPTDRRRTVALLEVRVEGLSDDVKDNFRKQLEEQLDTKRYRLADREFMKSAMLRSTKWTDGCVIGHCLTAIRSQSGVDLVLLAALTGSGTSFGFVVTLLRTDTGSVVDQQTDRCEVCRVNEVIGRAMLAAVELLNNVPDKLPDEAAEQTLVLERATAPLKQEIAAQDKHSTRVGIALLAVGLIGAVTGGALYMLDDSRPSYAVATATGGAAMAAGGIVVLTF